MMDELCIYFDLTPVPHQSVRTGRGFFYQPKHTIEFKNEVAYIASRCLPDGFKLIPREVPVIMEVIYYFRYRESEPQKNIGQLIPKVSKPDITDNTNKLFCDALAGVVYEQDQQIFDFHPKKYWWKEDGIYAKIQTV